MKKVIRIGIMTDFLKRFNFLEVSCKFLKWWIVTSRLASRDLRIHCYSFFFIAPAPPPPPASPRRPSRSWLSPPALMKEGGTHSYENELIYKSEAVAVDFVLSFLCLWLALGLIFKKGAPFFIADRMTWKPTQLPPWNESDILSYHAHAISALWKMF